MRWPLLALILLAVPAASAIVINEIMYDPDKCSDANCEWVELYNPTADEVNITYYYVDGKNISVASMPASAYLIVARNKNSFLTNYNSSCAVVQTTISLPNGNATIYLSDSDKNIIDFVTYAPANGGSGNDKTLSLANNLWRESSQVDGTPCQQNFPANKVDLNLEQTDTNEITAHLANNGLSDENITLEFFVDGNLSGSDALELASFDSSDVTFTVENLTAGNHIATVNATFSGNFVSAEQNFSNILPNADVYVTITINQTSNEYIVRSFPENASTYIGVSVFPYNFNGSDIIFGMFMFGEEFDKELDVSDLVAEEIDFGSYDLCAEVSDINNYNDTNLENNFVCANFTIVPPASQTRLRAKTFVDYEKYDLNQTLFWSAQVFPLSSGTVGNLTINMQKRNSRDSTELFKIENYNLSENIILSGNFTIPEDWIEGIYKVRAKFQYGRSYFDSRDSGQFWLNGLKDIGQANITFIKYPSALQFGSFGAIFVKFYAGNYGYDKIRLLAYGSPSQVLYDLNQEGLTTSDAQNASVAFEINSVKRGQEIYIALPAFTQQNCGADYMDKTYRVRVRAYQPSQNGWSEITTSDINVPISGKGVSCIFEAKKSSGGNSGRNIVLTKKPKEKNNILEVIRVPDSTGQGELFTAEIRVANSLNTTESFDVYSYVFEGREIMTEGGWTGNSQIIKLAPKESKVIKLDNAVKDDAVLGQHTLRIRAKFGKLTEDADSEVEIIASQAQEAEAGLNVQSQSQEKIPITAAAVWRTSKGGNMNAAIIILILVLMVVIFALIKSR
ncbi:MAG: lamin tail domain-containing protein [DPANN group archaeon]|nr:lamin tail domain-containing protein [DPANN group archaeon]